MADRHCYLFTLEVEPLKVGATYDELPLHCTLMPRFWSSLGAVELGSKVQKLLDNRPPVVLRAYESTLLGPKQVAANLIELTNELSSLNMSLYELLNELGVTYDNPAWVGKGHIFHVTEREHEKLEIGTTHLSKAVYLIEVKVPGYEHKRVVRQRFRLPRTQPLVETSRATPAS